MFLKHYFTNTTRATDWSIAQMDNGATCGKGYGFLADSLHYRQLYTSSESLHSHHSCSIWTSFGWPDQLGLTNIPQASNIKKVVPFITIGIPALTRFCYHQAAISPGLMLAKRRKIKALTKPQSGEPRLSPHGTPHCETTTNALKSHSE